MTTGSRTSRSCSAHPKDRKATSSGASSRARTLTSCSPLSRKVSWVQSRKLSDKWTFLIPTPRYLSAPAPPHTQAILRGKGKAMPFDFDRQALLNIFTTEASDGLLKLAKALDPRDGSTPTQEALYEHFIIAHNLTGASSLYGFTGCASLAKILARILEQAAPVSPTEWPSTVTILRDIVTTLRAQIDNINRKS